MVLPFGRPNTLKGRYAFLNEASAQSESDDQEDKDQKQKEYAAFLKEKERLCGPDGFVDSSKYQKPFKIKSKSKKESDELSKQKNATVVGLTQSQERQKKDQNRKLKVIEDHMWQHKQEERELKRIEGDIIKNQRAVRRVLREYEQDVSKRRMEENKKLVQSLDKYKKEQNDFLHKKEQTNKNRIEANIYADQICKDTDRKVQLHVNELARNYKTKISELELRKIEQMRLSSEFQTKLKKKEEEQFKLKQELAELAIALNMEALKGKQQDYDHNNNRKKTTVQRISSDRDAQVTHDNKQAKSDVDTKVAEMKRRKLSADLTLTRSHLQLRQREEGRHLQDTENRLRSNITEQKHLNEAATQAELDSKAKKIEEKVKEHEKRRKIIAAQAWKQKKEKDSLHENHYNSKFQKRLTEQQRREHEDQLKYFQKMVQKAEEREHNLFTKVRNSEYSRQKQEQFVKKLNQQLNEIKQQNAQKLKQEMAELSKNEQELEQKLIREQAQLAKVHSEREDTYNNLIRHRELMREDVFLLNEHEREHQRLLRIGERSQAVA